MTVPSETNDSAAIKDAQASDAKIPPEASDAIMDYLMGHYVMMKKITVQKLEHTLSAIADSKKIVKEAQQRNEIKPEHNLLEKLDNIEEAIAGLFPVDGFMLEELERIGEILENLSHIIKSRSENYIEADEALGAMITKITSEEYKKTYESARQVLDEIRDGENLLSGLSEKDYDKPEIYNSVIPEEVATGEEKMTIDKGYVILPSGKKARVI